MNENRIRSVFTDSDIGFPESYRSFRFPEAAERPEPRNGTTFYNTTTKALETCVEGQWVRVGETAAETEKAPEQAPLSFVEGDNVKLEHQQDGSIRISVPAVGDYTTAENIGQGTGFLYRGKSGTNLNLRRLRSTNENLVIETESDTITFTVKDPGETNTGRNVGDGVPVFLSKDHAELVFRSLSGAGGITVSEKPNGVIEIGSTFNIFPDGKIGLNLPASTDKSSRAGTIRYNPKADVFEGVLSTGMVQFSTSTGTFLSLKGGDLSGPLTAPTIGASDIHVSNRLTATEINLEGAKIVSGLTGTIDGYRFPEIAATFDIINKVEPGILIRTNSGYTSKTLRGIPNQIAILDDYSFGISPDPTIPGTDSMVLPIGGAGTRTDRIGAIRYDQAGRFEVCYPTGWETVVTSDHGSMSSLRVIGDAYISGTLNGRNIAAFMDRLDHLDEVRGLAYRSELGWVTSAISADPERPGIHVSDTGTRILIGIDAQSVVAPLLAQIDQTIVRSDSMVIGRTIDGRNLVRDGAVLDSLTGMEPGLIVALGHGQFASRAVTASALPSAAGISVSNSTGTGDIRIGLTLSDLPEVTTVSDTDWVVVSTASGNAKISMANLRSALGVK